MGKNILIFSDGTGQAGGLLPDERRSNVYKLFRATRCGPDTGNDPAKQVTFYDPGLGSKAAGEFLKIGWMRTLYNLLGQMTGLGITLNIIDCYAAIIQLWQPGDRIYLFGFSRGAYTARCVGGVLALCGVPRTKDGVAIKLDPKSVRAVAKEAVKKVYQHGSSKDQKGRFGKQRQALAANFRKKYGSNNEEGLSNAVPYFVGVWDTVAALGASWPRLIGFGIGIVAAVTAAIWGLSAFLASFLPAVADRITGWLSFLAPWFQSWPTSFTLFNYLLAAVLGASAAVFFISYLATHIKFATGTGDPIYKTLHMTLWGLQFYDRTLNDRVSFARHALSIDENRRDFARVPWTNPQGIHERKPGEMIWFEQIWFAGNHSDIGGSYAENEARLSDISLGWMVNEARRCPHPILVDEAYLKLYPDCAGMQHDERKSSAVPWKLGLRQVPEGAFLHPSVFDRLALPEVQMYDSLGRYDPEPLRGQTYNRYEVIAAPSNTQRA
jgi:uncharacterized protein (DUF2235 family)